MRRSVVVLSMLLAAAVLASCANPGEERRAVLRADAAQSAGEDRDAACERALAVLANRHADSRLADLRWQAAHNLGELRDHRAWDLLMERSLSALRDADPSVRRECVIALGKLPYEGPLDPRRRLLVERLTDRIAHEREGGTSGRFLERDALVRMAMLDTLVTLGMPPQADPDTPDPTLRGYRDVAIALRQIATVLIGGASTSIEGRQDEGIAERAIGGLALITGVQPAQLHRMRADSLTTDDFFAKWTDLIDALPRMDDYRQ